MRELHQHTGTVTRVRFAARSSTVVKVLEDLDGLLQNLVRRPPFDIDHKTDATGIVFEKRIVQPLFSRQARARNTGAYRCAMT